MMRLGLSWERHLMIRTCYGEARNQSDVGVAAVAFVILNRANNPRWWGKTIAEVCLYPKAFSCWNVNDPNRVKVINAEHDERTFDRIAGIIDAVCTGQIDDPTMNADHYHTRNVEPGWALKNDPVQTIGDHVFYRLELKP